MTDLQAIDAETARMVAGVCDAIVPGSARVRPEIYIDAKLARMPEGVRTAALAAFASLAEGDLAAAEASGAWEEIDFNTPLATRLAKDWSYLGIA